MRYVTNDQKEFTADSPEQVVDALRARSVSPGEDRADFMRLTAERVRAYNGAEVPTTDAAAFVQGLIEAGVLKQASND